MAEPIPFAQVNALLTAPDHIKGVKGIEACVDEEHGFTFTKWQLTDAELKELIRNGGKLYVVVMSAEMPPIKLDIWDPFKPLPP